MNGGTHIAPEGRNERSSSPFDDRRDAWIETFERAFRHVPLALYDEDQKLAERAMGELIGIAEAADNLYEFLWNTKETFDPGGDLREQGFVAVETSEDYEKEEGLALALGKALGKADAE